METDHELFRFYGWAQHAAAFASEFDSLASSKQSDALRYLRSLWTRRHVDFLYRRLRHCPPRIKDIAAAVNPEPVEFAIEVDHSWLGIATSLAGKRRALVYSLLGFDPLIADHSAYWEDRNSLNFDILERVWHREDPATWDEIKWVLGNHLPWCEMHLVGVPELIELAASIYSTPHNRWLKVEFSKVLESQEGDGGAMLWSRGAARAQQKLLTKILATATRLGMMAPFPMIEDNGRTVTAWDGFREGIAKLAPFHAKRLSIGLEKEYALVCKTMELQSPAEPIAAVSKSERGEPAVITVGKWTVEASDSAIRTFKLQNIEVYSKALNGDAAALKACEKLFGRNQLAKQFGSKATVSKTAAYQEIAGALWPNDDRVVTGQVAAKIGFDIAIEECALEHGDTTAMDVERRETVSLISACPKLPPTLKAELLAGLESGNQTDDQVRETLEAFTEQTKEPDFRDHL